MHLSEQNFLRCVDSIFLPQNLQVFVLAIRLSLFLLKNDATEFAFIPVAIEISLYVLPLALMPIIFCFIVCFMLMRLRRLKCDYARPELLPGRHKGFTLILLSMI